MDSFSFHILALTKSNQFNSKAKNSAAGLDSHFACNVQFLATTNNKRTPGLFVMAMQLAIFMYINKMSMRSCTAYVRALYKSFAVAPMSLKNKSFTMS
jgi:hypothetical protein